MGAYRGRPDSGMNGEGPVSHRLGRKKDPAQGRAISWAYFWSSGLAAAAQPPATAPAAMRKIPLKTYLIAERTPLMTPATSITMQAITPVVAFVICWTFSGTLTSILLFIICALLVLLHLHANRDTTNKTPAARWVPKRCSTGRLRATSGMQIWGRGRTRTGSDGRGGLRGMRKYRREPDSAISIRGLILFI